MNVHPASAIFPLMDGIELNVLADDIRQHGLLEPIVLHEGAVLDGRNRLRACELAGIEPHFVEWAASGGQTPVEWVVSHNLHRRHLTTAQRAALALDLLPRLEEEARERQAKAGGASPGALPPELEEAKGEAGEKAAQLVGVGRSTIAAVKAIQKRDESGEVVDGMRAGALNVAQAAREVGLDSRGRTRDGAGVLDSGRRDQAGKELPVYFGKGDRWPESTEPLRRYLQAWSKKGHSYTHINHREARKRVQLIDFLIQELTAARSDLTRRAEAFARNL